MSATPTPEQIALARGDLRGLVHACRQYDQDAFDQMIWHLDPIEMVWLLWLAVEEIVRLTYGVGEKQR